MKPHTDTIAFISGFTGLALQILAGRLLTPHFGSSIYTWGSIIGIFMVSLAVGYYLGGKFSKKASFQRILINTYMLLFFIAILIHFSESIISFTSIIPLSNRYITIPAVTLLFGPLSLLIGALTPQLITLSKKEHKGEASGHIFTLDTIGSIIGTFGATFILIPYFTLTTSFIIIGVILTLTTLYIQFNWKTIGIACIALLIIGGGFNPIDPSIFTEGETLYKTQTPYQSLEVRQVDTVRVLLLNDALQSGFDTTNPSRFIFKYTQLFDLPLYLENVTSVLFIGGGGFSGPNVFVERNISVDVVEIDPDVVDVAIKYFNTDTSKMNISIEDGRLFLQQTDKQYDLIVIDAYRKKQVPFHLATQEFYALVYEHLTPNGMVLSNVISSANGDSALFYRTMFATIDSVFDQTYAFQTREDPSQVQNIMILGSKKTTRIQEQTFYDIGLEHDLDLQWYLPTVDTSSVSILLDNKAPIDKILESLADSEFILE